MPVDERISCLFNPSSIAIVGSLQEGKVANLFLKSLVEGGFKGKIYPITSASKKVMGLTCYPDIKSVTGDIDLVLIAIPMSVMLDVEKECIKKGVKAAIILAASLEDNDTGRSLEAEIVKTAQKGGLRLLGGNSMGVLSTHCKLNTIMPVLKLNFEPGAASFVSQSGWVSQNFFLVGSETGLRFNKVVATGNEIDLTSLDFIEYFSNDPGTKIIGAYVEGVKDGRNFLRRLKAAAAKKPVIICKGGKTEAGSKAAASHTRSLAVNYDIFSAAVSQSGALIAGGFEELVDTAVAFTSPYLPRGNRIGFIVDSGGAGTLGVDACGPLGLVVPDLPESVKRELKEKISKVIPVVTSVRNPVDFVWSPFNKAGVDLGKEVIRLLDDYVDAYVNVSYYLSSFVPDDIFDYVVKGLEEARDLVRKPLVLVPGYIPDHPERVVQCVKRGIPVFRTPERALRAVANLLKYYKSRQ